MNKTVFNDFVTMNEFIEQLFKVNGKERIRIEKTECTNGMYYLTYTILPMNYSKFLVFWNSLYE